MTGKFIVFEGPDGSGKSTQAKLLAEDFTAQGKKVLTIREPGGTATGERVREILLDPELKEMCTRTELLLFMAARAQLVNEVIRPALTEGTFIICDRFLLSTMVYQGIAGGEEISNIRKIAEIATDSLQPDITVVVDVPTEIGMERV
ncbi:MAG: dTMP kinase, partial [Planctomycetota bacterium]